MQGYAALRKGRRNVANQAYHICTATYERRPVFERLACGRAVIRSLKVEHEAGHVESLAFVVMPDHLHWLIVLSGTRSLSECVKSVKCHSARRVNTLLGRPGKLWQKGFYDRAIRRQERLEHVARYIIANPLRAGIVASVRDYALWDAKWV